MGYCAFHAPQIIRQNPFHPALGEQHSWQQDGEEIHQVDEEFLEIEIHGMLRVGMPIT